MLYLGRLLSQKVKDVSQTVIGKLVDFCFLIEEGEDYPKLVAVVVKGRKREMKNIAVDFVENLSVGEISLSKKWEKMLSLDLVGNGIFFKASEVLDRQLVDLKGVRVVRVNDLSLGKIEGLFYLLGVDVGMAGIYRRLGWNCLPILSAVKGKHIDWKHVDVASGKLFHVQLKKKTADLHPADIANVMEDLSVKKASDMIQSLDEKTAAKVLGELPFKLRKKLFGFIKEDKAKKIVQEMSLDEVADLARMIPNEEDEYFSDDVLEKVKNIIHYNEDTAGGLMDPHFVKVERNLTVDQVRGHIKEISHRFRSIYYVYVVDEEGHLLGVLSIRTLLISDGKVKIGEIMSHRNLITVKTEDLDKKIAELMTKYNLLSIAVVDDSNKIVGIVTVDDVMRFLVPRA